jgi:hypothetical protein
MSALSVMAAGHRSRALAVASRPSRPVVIAAVTFAVYLALIVCSLAHGFSPGAFAFVGKNARQPTATLATHAPAGHSAGYDGQFALFIAVDPLGARGALDAPAYRYSHILYPMLARGAALGSPARVPMMLLIVNLVAVSIGAFAIARLLQRQRRSPWPALLVSFYPGMFLSVARDLNEPVAFALVALALLALSWESHRRVVLAAVLFAAAGLTRETTLLFPPTLAVCEAWRSRRLTLPMVIGSAAAPYLVWVATLRYVLQLGGDRPRMARYPLEGIIDAPHFRLFQSLFVVAPVLLLLVVLAISLRHRAAWSPFTVLLGVEIALSCSLGYRSFADWTSSSRLQLGVLIATLLALPQLRAGRLQLAAAALAFAPAVPVILFMFATGPGPR